MVDDIESADEFSEVMISAHAPATVGEQRLNIAATDEPFRRLSIDTIVAYVKAASRYPHVRQVNIHFAPKRYVADSQPHGQEGDYDLLIDGVREIAAFADTRGIEIVMENINAYWTDLGDDVQAEDVDWSDRNVYFGMAPEDIPCVPLEVQPGDVVVFQEYVLHSSFGGDPGRHQLALSFFANPTTEDEIKEVTDLHNSTKWTVRPSESYINSDRPRIRRMVSRLVELGFEPLRF